MEAENELPELIFANQNSNIFEDDDTDDHEHDANEDKNEYNWSDHEANNSSNDEDISDEDDDPVVNDIDVPGMDFCVDMKPNYEQVFLPMDGTYGNEDAGEIKRETDKMKQVLSNGGVSSGEEEAIQ